MSKLTTINDVFKFVRLHGVTAPKGRRDPTFELHHYQDTTFSQQLSQEKDPQQRIALASSFLSGDCAVKQLCDLETKDLEPTLVKLADQCNAMIGDLLGGLKADRKCQEFQNDLKRLSDTILASVITGSSAPKLEELKRGFFASVMVDSAQNAVDHHQISLAYVMALDVGAFFKILPPPETRAFQLPPWGRAKPVASVGVADLMVVKQNILRYEATEIAHIENVMAKEKRGRKHRFLERVEETISLDREVTDTKEREFETSERFELNKETSQTIREEQKYGFDLSVSAKYGSVLEVRSGFEFGSTESRESSAKSSTNYAKSVTDRSLQRIETRVREERIRKLVRESEEINKHAFENETDEHVVGIYQFVDKIYEAQVFNYGKREMFDLFVPEPASFLWHLENNPEDPGVADIPVAPEPLTIRPTDLSASPTVDMTFYSDLVAKYSATSVPAPKAKMLEVSESQLFPTPDDSGLSTGFGDNTDAPRYLVNFKMQIPAGYRPVNAHLSALVSGDDEDNIDIYYSLEKKTGEWTGLEADRKDHEEIRAGILGPTRVVAGEIRSIGIPLSDFHSYSPDSQNGLSINVLLWDASQWSVSVLVTCEQTDEEFQKWQLATYDILQSAYFDRRKEWENEVDKIKTAVAVQRAKSAPVGVPPSSRQNTIINELKKHCISILTGYWYDNPSVMVDRGTMPPSFHQERALEYGRAVRFFEHAFEWHQLQYAFYPYYWADKNSWGRRFRRTDPDYNYSQFLRAGAARVMLAVRPGFEYAVNLYLDKGVIWEGHGEPESIEDPTYLSIIDQLKEQSGEELEVPVMVGKSWEMRIPTSLIRLKEEANFPKWHKKEGEDWVWLPETEESEA